MASEVTQHRKREGRIGAYNTRTPTKEQLAANRARYRARKGLKFMPNFYCLDKDGEILKIVEAEDERDALAKAPDGTMKVEEKQAHEGHVRP